MSEPLTIYECPCGVRALYQSGPHEIPGSRGRDENDRITEGTPCPHGPLAAVRVFREEDVRPLYDAADAVTDNSAGPEERVALLMAWDAFPAPAEWK